MWMRVCVAIVVGAVMVGGSVRGEGKVSYSSPDEDKTPKGAVVFHGPFSRETVYVTVEGVGGEGWKAPAFVEVSFDLLMLRSWDGSVVVTAEDEKPSALGPDYFRLGIGTGKEGGGGRTLMYTTFSNMPSAEGFRNESKSQNYPSQLPGDLFTPGSGSWTRNTMGYNFPDMGPDRLYQMDTMYGVKFVVPWRGGAGEKVVLEMQGINLQDMHDESWGVRNVEVKGVAAPESPGVEGIAAAFKNLLDPESATMVADFQTLINGMDETAAWIEGHVKPMPVNEKVVMGLIAEVCAGDEKMAERDAAHKKLVEMGHAVEPLLREARRGAGADGRMRIDWVLGTLGVRKPVAGVREVVAAERVLEVIGTERALKVRRMLTGE